MTRDTLRLLALLRRVLCELHALPRGALPLELEDAIEDAIAPGFRGRVFARYLAELTREGVAQ